ncbi:hypothetical protein F4604DRAFT_1940916 [Suillus subluteus]|nr:hypothetical protein F4604DRAFT_1940916 [Suillus subluteus]
MPISDGVDMAENEKVLSTEDVAETLSKLALSLADSKRIPPLLAASLSCSIIIQLAVTLKDILAHDCPDRWLSLFHDVEGLFGSGDLSQREVGVGVIAALKRSEADDLPGIITTLFPVLITTLPSQPASQEIPAILSSRQKTVITIANLGHASRAQNCPSTHVKKWAYVILGRLFDCFGHPSQFPSPMQNIHDYLCVRNLQGAIHRVTGLYVSGPGKKCQYPIFSFSQNVCQQATVSVNTLKPHIGSLVVNFAFPILSSTASKQATM